MKPKVTIPHKSKQPPEFRRLFAYNGFRGSGDLRGMQAEVHNCGQGLVYTTRVAGSLQDVFVRLLGRSADLFLDGPGRGRGIR